MKRGRYHFRVQATTGPERVTVRARVWAEGSAEPGVWQAEAYDASGTRITAGAVGVRTYGPGDKCFDDLVVRPLPSYTTTTRVITYTYECTASLKRSERDNLYRLTGGDYCTGEEFCYAYDPVGNPVSAYASRDRLSHCPHLYPDGHYRHHLCLPFDCAHLCLPVPGRCATSAGRAGDAANRLDYFYEGGVLTDLAWDANPLRRAAEPSPPGFTARTSPPGFTARTSPPGFTARTSPPGFTARTSPPGFTARTSWQLAHPGHQRVYLGCRQPPGGCECRRRGQQL